MIAVLAFPVLAVLLIGMTPMLKRRCGATAHVRRGGVLVGAMALMLGCAVALAPDASASKPVHTPAPIGTTNTFPAGDVCPFTLQTTLIGGNQVFTFFDDGRFLATGLHIDQLTNLDTGASITLNLRGPVYQVPTADGGSILRAAGKTSFIFFPGDAGPGDTQTGRFYLFIGHFVAVSDPSFVVTTFRSFGKSRDVCAMLT
jgi:hypothetical protein